MAANTNAKEVANILAGYDVGTETQGGRAPFLTPGKYHLRTIAVTAQQSKKPGKSNKFVIVMFEVLESVKTDPVIEPLPAGAEGAWYFDLAWKSKSTLTATREFFCVASGVDPSPAVTSADEVRRLMISAAMDDQPLAGKEVACRASNSVSDAGQTFTNYRFGRHVGDAQESAPPF